MFYFFSERAVLRKLFDIRFSYKHRNFSPVCLLVKMASKTVTSSIRRTLYWHVFHIYRSITHEEAINYLSYLYYKGKIKLIPELVLTSSKFILVSRLLFCNRLDHMGRHLDQLYKDGRREPLDWLRRNYLSPMEVNMGILYIWAAGKVLTRERWLVLGYFIKSSENLKTMFLWEAFICYFELLILDYVTLVAQFPLKFKFY